MIFMISSKPKFKYKRVKVIWQDIVTDPSWFDDLVDVDKLCYSWCEDTGFLYFKDKWLSNTFILQTTCRKCLGTSISLK